MRTRILFASCVALLGAALVLVLGRSADDRAIAAQAPMSPKMQQYNASIDAVHGYFRRQAKGRVKVRGWIEQVHVDQKHEHYDTVLYTSRGEMHPVEFEGKLRGTKKPIESGLIVEGDGRLEGSTVVLAAAQADGELSEYRLSPSETMISDTHRDVLVVPITFTDDTTMSMTQPQLDAVFNGNGNSVRKYYRESSGQKLSMDAVVLDWKPGEIAGNDNCDYTRYSTAARAVAQKEADAGRISPLASFEHVVTVFPDQKCGWLGRGSAPGASSWIPLPDNPSTFDIGTPAHELGHNLGLNHSNAASCSEAAVKVPVSDTCSGYEYADRSDVMGSSGEYRLLNGYNRATLGLLPLVNTKTVDPATPTTNTLYDVEVTESTPTPQLLRIPRASAIRAGNKNRSYYYVDLRKPQPGATFDDYNASDPIIKGVSIRWSADYGSMPVQEALNARTSRSLTESTFRSNIMGGLPARTLIPQQSFYDYVEDFTITLSSLSSGVASVKVRPGPPIAPATNVAIVDGELRVTASSGVVNGILLGRSGSTISVIDTSAQLAIGTSSGCSRVRANKVDCPASSVTSIKIDAGDLDDDVSLASTIKVPSRIDGGAGSDALEGGDGDDVFDGGTGRDLVAGYGGTDTVSYATRTANVVARVPSGSSSSTENGEDGEQDYILDAENVTGGAGNDRLYAGANGSVLTGGAGSDSMFGAEGNDTFNARNGASDMDTITCGDGTDTIIADAGDVALAGDGCEPADRSGQAVIVSGPADGSAVATTTPTFAFTPNDSALKIECKLENGASPGGAAFSTCAAPTTAASTSWIAPTQTEGIKTLSVRAVSGSTVVGTTVRRTFTVDTTRPSTTIVNAPPGSGTGTSATFEFGSSEAGSTFRCALDGAALAPCAGIVTFDLLSEAQHSVTVVAVDRAGNQALTPTTQYWKVDRTAPDTTATGPSGSTTDTTPDFTIGGTPSADVAGYECRISLIGSTAVVPWTSCGTAYTGGPLDDGNYRLEARAYDAAGNYDAAPATRDFAITGTAATVSTSTIGGVLTATVTGGSNSKDVLTIGTTGSAITVAAQASLVAGAGCTTVTSSSVSCASATAAVVNTGSADDSVLVSGAVPTTFDGGTGDDRFFPGTGKDSFTGGSGTDTVDYSSRTTAVRVTLNGVADDGLLSGTEQDNIAADVETVLGGSAGDTLTGGSGFAILRGQDGADTLTGGAGGSTLDGGLGSDYFYGGTGLDTVDYSLRTDAIQIFQRANSRSGSISNSAEYDRVEPAIEQVRGSAATTPGTRDYYADGPGNNRFWAGPGGATVNADGGGNDVIIGSQATDDITDGPGNDNYFTYGGDDSFSSGSTTDRDVYSGGDGTDTVRYSAKAQGVTLNNDGSSTSGVPGENDLIADDVENLTGSSYADTITGSSDSNTIDGLAGDDVIDGGLGSDVIDGDNGVDTVTYASREDAVRTTEGADGYGGQVFKVGVGEEGDKPKDAERFLLGSGDDTFEVPRAATAGWIVDAGAGDDNLEGGSLGETLIGGSGRDTIDGKGGADTIQAQSGDDVVTDSAGDDTYDLGDGDDRIVFPAGTGADGVIGGAGTDLADFSSSSANLVVSLNDVADDGDPAQPASLKNLHTDVENVTTGSGDDTVSGSSAANVVRTGAGDDVVTDGDGTDTYDLGDGNDQLAFGSGTGNDSVTAGGGIDTADFSAINANVNVSLDGSANDGDPSATGSLKNVATDVEVLKTGSGNDTITGDGAANTIFPGGGNDIVNAGAGADTITATDGAVDRIDAGADADTVNADQIDLVANGELAPFQIDAGVSSPAAVNLTTDSLLGASTDWAKWNGATGAPAQRKSGTAVIGSLAKNGSAGMSAPTGSSTFSWSNAAVAPTSSSSATGVATGSSLTHGFRFTVPLNANQPTTVKVHVGLLNGGSGQLRVWNNATPTAITYGPNATNGGTALDRTYTVSLRPSAAGTATIDWGLTATNGSTTKAVFYSASLYR